MHLVTDFVMCKYQLLACVNTSSSFPLLPSAFKTAVFCEIFLTGVITSGVVTRLCLAG